MTDPRRRDDAHHRAPDQSRTGSAERPMPRATRPTRRAYLAGAATAAVGVAAGLAGCLGGGGSGGSTGTTVDSLPPPVQGDPNADVVVKVFEDFSCPHCREYELTVLPQLESAYVKPGTIRYEHHDFPIPVDKRWSWVVASAARGVQDHVGDAAFFEYSHSLFAHQTEYSLDLIASLAADVGADGKVIRRDAKDQTYRPVVEADRKQGVAMGLQGTPQVYVNGTMLSSHGYDAVSKAIDQAQP